MRSIKLYTSETCKPCQSFKPVLKAAAESANINCVEVDINTNPAETAQRCVRGVPTTLLFENGVVLRRYTGAMTAPQLKDFLR